MSEDTPALPGALVVSLDFELHWGVRDHQRPDGPYRASLLGARAAIPRMLALFEEFEVAATWATVGFLFAASRAELERFAPRERPVYADPALSPYAEPLGEGEEDDPLHYAPSLIEAIARTPLQEIATHTFSHFYCLEEGQDRRSFAADLQAARAIAGERGIRIESIVFPRNQHDPAYDDVLLAHGITVYRGNARGRLYRQGTARENADPLRRAGRLLDAYLGLGDPSVGWSEVLQPTGVANVRASAFLRPWSPALRRFEPLRLARLQRGLQDAARRRRIFHLWWHPHNFGSHTDENLASLRRLLLELRRCREEHGMRSLSMAEAARLARDSVAAEGATRPPAPGEEPTPTGPAGRPLPAGQGTSRG